MQITSITLGTTRKVEPDNPKCFEFDRLDVTGIPSDGQTADELFAELKAFVYGGAPEKTEPAKPAAKEESPTKEAEAKKEAPKKRGRPPKKQQLSDAEQAVRHALDSETLQDLFDRFNAARKFAKQFSVDTWESAFIQLSDRYKELNSPDADETLVRSLTDAFKAEYSYIQEAQQAA